MRLPSGRLGLVSTGSRKNPFWYGNNRRVPSVYNLVHWCPGLWGKHRDMSVAKGSTLE